MVIVFVFLLLLLSINGTGSPNVQDTNPILYLESSISSINNSANKYGINETTQLLAYEFSNLPDLPLCSQLMDPYLVSVQLNTSTKEYNEIREKLEIYYGINLPIINQTFYDLLKWSKLDNVKSRNIMYCKFASIYNNLVYSAREYTLRNDFESRKNFYNNLTLFILFVILLDNPEYSMFYSKLDSIMSIKSSADILTFLEKNINDKLIYEYLSLLFWEHKDQVRGVMDKYRGDP